MRYAGQVRIMHEPGRVEKAVFLRSAPFLPALFPLNGFPLLIFSASAFFVYHIWITA
jgi:hypothetical protein